MRLAAGEGQRGAEMGAGGKVGSGMCCQSDRGVLCSQKANRLYVRVVYVQPVDDKRPTE
jgi:hypothetical protein